MPQEDANNPLDTSKTLISKPRMPLKPIKTLKPAPVVVEKEKVQNNPIIAKAWLEDDQGSQTLPVRCETKGDTITCNVF